MSDRKKLIEQMNTQLFQCDQDIDELEEKARTASSELQDGYRKQIEKLFSERDETMQKLEELKSDSESGWVHAKQGMEQAWGSVSHGFSSAKNRIFGKAGIK